jgi:hypothetical protein
MEDTTVEESKKTLACIARRLVDGERLVEMSINGTCGRRVLRNAGVMRSGSMMDENRRVCKRGIRSLARIVITPGLNALTRDLAFESRPGNVCAELLLDV